MDIVVCPWYWLIIVFVAGCVLTWFAYSHVYPTPELTQNELFEAMDRINEFGDYTRRRELQDELYKWMNWESEMGTVSKELYDILHQIKYRGNDPE